MPSITPRLSIFYFVYFLIIGSFMPFWNTFLEEEGYTKAVIGVLGTIPVLTRIIAPGIWGYVADKTQKRMQLIQLAAFMQLATWAILMYVIQDLPLLIFVLFIFSFFQNAILAQFEAVALYWLNYHPGRYGKVRLWGSIGFIVAATGLGAWFNSHSLLTLPNWLLLFSLITLFISFIVPNPPQQPHDYANHSIGKTLKRPAVLLFFSLEFLLLFSHAPFYTFYTNYLKDYGYSSTNIGMLWGAGVVAEVAMFVWNAPLLARFNLQILMLVCLLMTAIRWALVGAYPQYFYIQLFAQGLHAFSFGLFQVIAMRMLHYWFKPVQQGRAQGLYSMTWGLAVGLGGLLAGQYWMQLTGPNIFFIAAFVCVIAVIVAVIGFKRLQIN